MFSHFVRMSVCTLYSVVCMSSWLFLSVYLWRNMCLFLCLLVWFLVCLAVCIYVCSYVCLSLCIFSMRVCLSVLCTTSLSLYACLYVCLPLRLSVCRFVTYLIPSSNVFFHVGSGSNALWDLLRLHSNCNHHTACLVVKAYR